MSWPTWSAAAAPIPTPVAAAAPVQSTLLPVGINSAPAVVPPNLHHQYSPEQWAQAQQQNWQQWAQWQQQYQQWHQQYGAEYQKSLTALQTGVLPPATQSTLPTVQPPLPAAMATALAPPLPLEEPPVNPASVAPSYSTAPIKPTQTGYITAPPLMTQQVVQQRQATQHNQLEQYSNRQNWQSSNNQKRPYSQENEYPEPSKRSMVDSSGSQWKQQSQGSSPSWPSSNQNYSQPPPQTQATPSVKANVEELSEAEKKFDKEFAAWEAQFNKWKEQNANHPDKTQYREYEKKWESWRNSLLERREQMRKKRLALVGQTVTAVTKPQSFTQPPPNVQTSIAQALPGQSMAAPKPSLLGPGPTALLASPKPSETFFSKPPPNQNNEPLTFKAATFPQSTDDNEHAGSDFLKSSSTTRGGIPGLDLVVEGEDEREGEEDIPERDFVKAPEAPPAPVALQGPDFDAISKGINSILGDQKLLNMLSMVSQNASGSAGRNVATDSVSAIPASYVQGRPNFSEPPRNVATDSVSAMPPSYVQGRPNFSEPPRNVATDSVSAMPPSYVQGRPNFSEPPPSHGNFTVPPPFNGGSTHTNLPLNERSKQSFDNQSNRDDFGQSREVVTKGGFAMGTNYDQDFRQGSEQSDRYSAPPPPDMRSNFGPGGQRSSSDNHNRGFSRDKFSHCPNNFENRQINFNRDDRFGDDNFDESRGDFDHYNREDNTYDRDNSYDRSDGFKKYDDYENYDEDDYESYHQKFVEEDEQYPENDNQRFNNQRPPPVTEIPPLMQEPVQMPVKEEMFEATTVIDYEHKSQKTDDPDVFVEPFHMFDYRHKPCNRIPLPERPKWLADAVKFIREFDPLAARYERSSAVAAPPDRFTAPSRDEDRFKRGTSFEGRDILGGRGNRTFVRGDFQRDTDDYHRNRGDYHRDRGDFHRDRGDYHRDRGDYHRDRGDHRRENIQHDGIVDRGREKIRTNFEGDEYVKENTEKASTSDIPPKKHDSKLNKQDFDDLSDDEMDWEQGEQRKYQQHEHVIRKSRSKSPELSSNPPNPSNNSSRISMIEDLINSPGRFNRPPRIVIILRGPPGSGKTFLARQIKDKEVENGGSAPRILSLDDYFMVEHEKKILQDGKMQTVKEMVYEYEAEMEESYRTSFLKSFKKTVTDGYFPFIIVDNVNDKVKHFGEMWSFAKQNGFQVYICQLDLDPVICVKRNIHNRSQAEIEECISGWEPTPSHHPTIDASNLLSTNITEVEMELEECQQQNDQPSSSTEEKKEVAEDQVRSKWDTFDCSSNNLAKLDGVSKPLRKSRTMEEYLQLESEWEPPKTSQHGKKRVRWADLEEQREQEKMRRIGFVVGHTNWQRMMDPSGGSKALTQTKFI